MDHDIQTLVSKRFSQWVERISFREIKANESLIRAIERFERNLNQSLKNVGGTHGLRSH